MCPIIIKSTPVAVLKLQLGIISRRYNMILIVKLFKKWCKDVNTVMTYKP